MQWCKKISKSKPRPKKKIGPARGAEFELLTIPYQLNKLLVVMEELETSHSGVEDDDHEVSTNLENSLLYIEQV